MLASLLAFFLVVVVVVVDAAAGEGKKIRGHKLFRARAPCRAGSRFSTFIALFAVTLQAKLNGHFQIEILNIKEKKRAREPSLKRGNLRAGRWRGEVQNIHEKE